MALAGAAVRAAPLEAEFAQELEHPHGIHDATRFDHIDELASFVLDSDAHCRQCRLILKSLLTQLAQTPAQLGNDAGIQGHGH
jgi:hypothetical protein